MLEAAVRASDKRKVAALVGDLEPSWVRILAAPRLQRRADDGACRFPATGAVREVREKASASGGRHALFDNAVEETFV